MANDSCSKILEGTYQAVEAHLQESFVLDAELAGKIRLVAVCPSNRTGARFLLAATLAKVDKPDVDIRKPLIQAYPNEEKADAYGGRYYDEQYVFDFIMRRKLACSSTTAFLIPAFRT